jgi:hypothetical protein
MVLIVLSLCNINVLQSIMHSNSWFLGTIVLSLRVAQVSVHVLSIMTLLLVKKYLLTLFPFHYFHCFHFICDGEKTTAYIQMQQKCQH